MYSALNRALLAKCRCLVTWPPNAYVGLFESVAILRQPNPPGPNEESGEDRVQRVADVDHATGVGDVVASSDGGVAVAQDVPGDVQPSL